MQRIADILAKEQATLWINHDKPSSEARRHAHALASMGGRDMLFLPPA